MGVYDLKSVPLSWKQRTAPKQQHLRIDAGMVRHQCDHHATHVRARTFARAAELHRPCWVMLLLGMGLNFLATGVIVGVVGARQARVQHHPYASR